MFQTISLKSLRYRYTLFTCLLFSSLPLTVYSQPTVLDVYDESIIAELSSSKVWLNLVHYKSSRFSYINSRKKSSVITDTFFLSSTGREDPASELKATIVAMNKALGGNVEGDLNSHAQCRFPARYYWLKQVAPDLLASAPSVICTDFLKWSAGNKVDSVSLFFAAGYLGNPASYYGHILLRLNATEVSNASNLLSTSMDFGAIFPQKKDGPLTYIAKGLFGGYDAGFTHGQFYKQDHNYGEDQMRDLWEYRLELTESQKQIIIAHSWELLRNKFVYYFLRNNCAYAMGELVEVAIDSPLFERKIPWVVPHSIFSSAAEVNNQDQPLVSKVIFHPSLQSRLYKNYALLSVDEKLFIQDFTRRDAGFSDAGYSLLASDSKVRVVNVLQNYYQYRVIDSPDSLPLKKTKKSVLLERLRLPIESNAPSSTVNDESSLEPPHLGQRPTMLRVGALYNATFKDGLHIQIRPAYFDTLSSDIGRPDNSTLVMGNVEMEVFDNDIQLSRFDLLDIEALNTSYTGLPGDGSYMWSLNVGIRKQNLSCNRCLTAGIEGGVGQSYLLGNVGTYFFAINGRLQESYRKSGILNVTPRIGFISKDSWYGKSEVSIGYRDFINDGKQDDWLFKFEHRIGPGRNWDIRLSYEKDDVDQFFIGASAYW